MQTDLAYQIALSHSLLASTTLIRIVEAMGSAEGVWQATKSQLDTVLKEKQLKPIRSTSWEQLIATRDKVNPEQLLETYQKLKIDTISLTDERYPARLQLIHDPPFLLYVRGQLPTYSQRFLGVVGTRRFTDYGRRAVESLIQQLAPVQPCIVSGLAAGIDTLAHHTALAHNLQTVAVFGTGIDQIYPKPNEKLANEIVASGNGALISEYPLGITGDTFTFPRRNRIIAGMSQGTLVVEGNLKSGALITAKYALEENRQVFAVPGNIFSPMAQGPNQLIKDGATPVQHGDEICQALNWSSDIAGSTSISSEVLETSATPETTETTLALLNADERQVLMNIGYEPTAFEIIQAQTSPMPTATLQTALTMLELQGLVNSHAGTRFSRN